MVAGMELPGGGMSLRKLADEVSVTSEGDGDEEAEFLIIKVSR
jgi:hypothetical protein